MKKGKIKITGRLKTYLNIYVYLAVALIAINILIFLVGGLIPGLIITAFSILNFAVIIYIKLRTQPIIMNELISFATEYGQIQKRLLRELNLPSAIFDDTGKIVWTNIEFEKTVHQEKGYRKSITSLFPSITPDKFPVTDREEIDIEIEYEEKSYNLKMKKISLKDMADNSNILEGRDYEGYLIVV